MDAAKPASQLAAWDGDTPAVDRIWTILGRVPPRDYDDITKLVEYAVGDLITEHNATVVRVADLEAALRDSSEGAAAFYDRAVAAEAQVAAPTNREPLVEYICAHDHRWFMPAAWQPNGCPMCNTITFRRALASAAGDSNREPAWKHSVYCASRDGKPCTCQEPAQ